MQKKVLIFLVLVAVGIGMVSYLLGRASYAPPPSEEGEMMSQELGHVHALLYIPQERLLMMGTHEGLLRSTDEGKSWEKVEARGHLPAGDFMSLVPDPKDPKVIYAGGHDLGVVKSLDGGLTWQKADNGIAGTDIHGLTINQRAPDMLFAYSVGNGVFRSADGARTWQRMDDGPETPSVRSLTYMAVQTEMDRSMGWENWGVLFAGTAAGIFQSYSCFCGWTQTTKEFTDATVYALATVHAEPRTIYAGTKRGVFKSTDEGKTWKEASRGLGGRMTAIAISPVDPKVLFASSEDGVVYKSTEGGEIWAKVGKVA
ncbi:MAG: hypothetical protein HY555_05815 [Euryarchaeota archaeon]|nr:hypothetical protein [Euryarchaeota archaeon]